MPWVAGVIIERLSPLTYLVQVDTEQLWKCHLDHLRVRGDQPVSEDTQPQDSEWNFAESRTFSSSRDKSKAQHTHFLFWCTTDKPSLSSVTSTSEPIYVRLCYFCKFLILFIVCYVFVYCIIGV